MGSYLDLTAGGGGHLAGVLKKCPTWLAEAWDQDPLAEARIRQRIGKHSGFDFKLKNFREEPRDGKKYTYILADLGISSFQVDDPERGMSLFSDQQPDFRMNPQKGENFLTWLRTKSIEELRAIFENFGEEPRAEKLASAMKSWAPDSFQSSKILAQKIADTLSYKSPSRNHPATRAFQALRMAINGELDALKELLDWAPQALELGGRLAIITFHSLEDRLVKNRFRRLAQEGSFVILTKKPVLPSLRELEENPRSRSAKLRILERGA